MAFAVKDSGTKMVIMLMSEAEARGLRMLARSGKDSIEHAPTAKVLYGTPSQIEAAKRAYQSLDKVVTSERN